MVDPGLLFLFSDETWRLFFLSWRLFFLSFLSSFSLFSLLSSLRYQVTFLTSLFCFLLSEEGHRRAFVAS